MVATTTTKRVRFNLNNFLERMQVAIEDRHDLIEEEIEAFENFLGRVSQELLHHITLYLAYHRIFCEYLKELEKEEESKDS